MLARGLSGRVRTPNLTHAVLLCGAGLLGCASAAPQRVPVQLPRQREPEAAEPPDSLTISGLRGTLSAIEIQRALEPRLPKFLRCAERRLAALETLAGTITFSFHIATNGAVAGVSPSASTLGDRDTERCMLEVAQATRFPAPHGGEADFTWPLELPIDPEVRPPVELGPDAAHPALSAPSGNVTAGEALHGSCGGGQMVVTAYIEPGGAVLAAGVSAPDLVTSGELDCIASGVKGFRFADPGSYLGKLTFTLP